VAPTQNFRASDATLVSPADFTLLRNARREYDVREDAAFVDFGSFTARGVPHCRAGQPPLVFDRKWCKIVCGESDDDDDDVYDDGFVDRVMLWIVEVDQSDTRARVIQRGWDTLTLRGASPLPRPPHATSASFRVVIEDYGANKYCTLGFVPSDAGPVLGREICEYGGWYISVEPFHSRPLLDSGAFASSDADSDPEAFILPAVPPGSAVEFTVDYTAATGKCRVAFFGPGDTASPHKVVDLRFVEKREYCSNPARSDPVLTHAALHPAVGMRWVGGTVRFASAPVGEM
jgi:hypothetical protein